MTPGRNRAFRAVGWLFCVGGLVYLYLGGRGLMDGSAVSRPMLILGLIAIVVGTALLRWARRNLVP